MRYILIDTSKLGPAGLEEAHFIQEKGIALDDHEALEVFKEAWDAGYDRGFSGKWFTQEEYWEKYLKQGEL